MPDHWQLQRNSSNVSNNISADSEGKLISSPISVAEQHILKAAVIQTRDEDLKSLFEDLHHSIIVNEEVERSKQLIADSQACRPTLAIREGENNGTHTSKPRLLQLKFLQKIDSPVFTGIELKGEGGNTLAVALVDDITGEIVESGPEASAQVDIVILKGGGFDDDDDHFNYNIVRERDDCGHRLANKSLLAEDVRLKLNKGIGVVHKLRFKHTSTHMKITNFRLGARASGTFDGVQILEAKPESFIVKDRRSLRNEKRDPPSLSDFVWRLVNIDKRGNNWMKLQEQNVKTVKDFLILLLRDPQRLNNMLSLRPSALEETVDHARRGIPDNSVLLFYSDYNSHQENMGVVFDIFEHLHGLVVEQEFVAIGSASENDKAKAHKLLSSAREHWEKVIHFTDIKSLQQSVASSDYPRLHPGASGSRRDISESPEMFREAPITSSAGGAEEDFIIHRSSHNFPDHCFLSPGLQGGEYQDDQHTFFVSDEMMLPHLPESNSNYNDNWNTPLWSWELELTGNKSSS